MEALKSYLVSVLAATVLCSVVSTFREKKGTVSAILRLLSGLFLALTVIRPLIGVSLSGMDGYIGNFTVESSSVISKGIEMAQFELSSIIKAETEAYILDKATSLGVDLEVEVILKDAATPLPGEVILSGRIAPYAKAKLSALITEQLGIPKEAQRWSG